MVFNWFVFVTLGLVCLCGFWFISLHGKQPSDCKLIFEIVSQLHAELGKHYTKTTPFGGINLATQESYLCRSYAIFAKLVIFTPIVQVMQVLSVRRCAYVELIRYLMEVDE